MELLGIYRSHCMTFTQSTKHLLESNKDKSDRDESVSKSTDSSFFLLFCLVWPSTKFSWLNLTHWHQQVWPLKPSCSRLLTKNLAWDLTTTTNPTEHWTRRTPRKCKWLTCTLRSHHFIFTLLSPFSSFPPPSILFSLLLSTIVEDFRIEPSFRFFPVVCAWITFKLPMCQKPVYAPWNDCWCR